MFKQRLIEYACAFLLLVVLGFLLPRLMAGDPVVAIYGDAMVEMTDELRADLRRRFGLDESMAVQFLRYITNLAQGDLGYSAYRSARVSHILGKPMAWTLLLTSLSLAISFIIGVVLAVETTWRRGSVVEKGALAGFLVLLGMPEYFVASLLVVGFSFHLGLFPISGAMTVGENLTPFCRALDIAWHLALPVTTLTLVQLPGIFLLMRGAMSAVMGRRHIVTARGKGVRERAIQYGHAARVALIPVVTRTGVRMGSLVAGALFVETVFAYPGLGFLTYDSLLHHDYPVLHGVLLLMAIMVLLANGLTDIMVTKLDPRTRDEHFLRQTGSI
jgi:peptide/nickel transport system permease protein